jgi:hypothetical protein
VKDWKPLPDAIKIGDSVTITVQGLLLAGDPNTADDFRYGVEGRVTWIADDRMRFYLQVPNSILNIESYRVVIHNGKALYTGKTIIADIKPTGVMVKQRADKDCYLCGLCMALGISYERMTELIGADFVAELQNNGTFGTNVVKLHRLLGLIQGVNIQTIYRHAPTSTGHRGSSLHFTLQSLWGRRALLQVRSLNYDSDHLVYWDGQTLYDPSNKLVHTIDTVQPSYITLFNERPAQCLIL